MLKQDKTPRVPITQQSRVQSLGHALLGALIATVATTTLLWLMNFLVKSKDLLVEPRSDVIKFDIFKLDRSEIVEDNSEPEIERIPDVTPPPQFPADDWPTPNGTVASEIPQVDFGPGPADGEPAIKFSRGYMPVTRFPARYPAAAVKRGIEGYCDVAFMVTRSGTVRNVSVIKNQCSDPLFYKASVRAAERFKYMPTVFDGETVETPNVTTRFRFTLDD